MNLSNFLKKHHNRCTLLWIFKVLTEQSDVVWCQLARSWQILSSYQWGPPHSERETGSPLNNISYFKTSLKNKLSRRIYGNFTSLYIVLFMTEFTFKSCLFSVGQHLFKVLELKMKWFLRAMAWGRSLWGCRIRTAQSSCSYHTGAHRGQHFTLFSHSPTLRETYLLNLFSLHFMEIK